jgi:hypothetical protein
MSTDLAISAIAALALAAHLSSRRGAQGSASTGPHEAELERLLDFVSRYDGVGGFDSVEFFGLLQREGFEVVGAGGSRIVVGLGPHLVAKIDYDTDGSANRAEADLWHGFREVLDGHVVPVVGTRLDDRVLLMERATPLLETARDKRDLKRARRELPMDLEEAEWDFNWGRHNGTVKLLDYVS